MADPYAPNEDWYEGYDAGFDAGYDKAMRERRPSRRTREVPRHMSYGSEGGIGRTVDKMMTTKRKGKRRQSKKQKILNEMADKKWRKYKKGSGKKTYFDIRGMVSRSEAYKKKVKNL